MSQGFKDVTQRQNRQPHSAECVVQRSVDGCTANVIAAAAAAVDAAVSCLFMVNSAMSAGTYIFNRID